MVARVTTPDQVGTFRPIVENANWGATSLCAIRAVLGSACDSLLHAFGRSPDAPVHVARWDQVPMVFYDKRPYEIRINARDTYWSQYVYQFSHELCHVMTNFDRHKNHRHKWFEESLCELASLFVLRQLAETWRTHPPFDISKASDFAPSHAAYSERIESKYPGPDDGDYARWLTENIDALEADPIKRDLNGVVAVALLNQFRNDPVLWRDCGALNLWDPTSDATFSDYLDSWTKCLKNRGSKVTTPAVVRKVLLP